MKRENISSAFLKEKKILEDESKKKYIMKEIELKTEKQVVTGLATGAITNPLLEKNKCKQNENQDILLQILSNGAKEFKEKTGRDMTYGEMREMYG